MRAILLAFQAEVLSPRGSISTKAFVIKQATLHSGRRYGDKKKQEAISEL